jgi:hypothetical protein
MKKSFSPHLVPRGLSFLKSLILKGIAWYGFVPFFLNEGTFLFIDKKEKKEVFFDGFLPFFAKNKHGNVILKKVFF